MADGIYIGLKRDKRPSFALHEMLSVIAKCPLVDPAIRRRAAWLWFVLPQWC